MSQSLKYVGTVSPWWETTTTGRPQVWRSGQVGDVDDTNAALLIATGLFVASGALPTTPAQAYAYVGPVATLPAAAAVGIALAYVTDLGAQGGAVLRSNGSAWRPTHPVTLCAFNSPAGQVIAAGAAETAIGSERAIPAGLLQPGDVLRTSGLVANGAADANQRSCRLRISATAGQSASGALWTLFSTTSGSSVNHTWDKDVGVLDAVTLSGVSSWLNTATSQSGALQTLTVPSLAAPTYWGLSVLPSATQNWIVYQIAVQLVPGS